MRKKKVKKRNRREELKTLLKAIGKDFMLFWSIIFLFVLLIVIFTREENFITFHKQKEPLIVDCSKDNFIEICDELYVEKYAVSSNLHFVGSIKVDSTGKYFLVSDAEEKLGVIFRKHSNGEDYQIEWLSGIDGMPYKKP